MTEKRGIHCNNDTETDDSSRRLEDALNHSDWFNNTPEVNRSIKMKNEQSRRDWHGRLGFSMDQNRNDMYPAHEEEKRGKQKNEEKENNKIKCEGCKKEGHTTKECYFANKTCNSCKQKGHLQRHCTESRKDNRDSRKGIINCQICKKEGHSAEICEFRGEKDKGKNKEQKEEHNKERRIPEYNEEKQKNAQMLTQMWNVMMNLCQQKN